VSTLARANRKAGLPTTVVAPGRGYLNPRMIVTLRYHDVISMSSLTAGSVGSWSFRPNGPFDPDRTGTGHQPNGYDKLASDYLRYLPLSTRYKILVPVLSDTFQLTCAPYNGVFPTVNTVQSFNDLSELPFAHWSCLSYSGGGPPVKFTGNINLRSLNGASEFEYYGDDRFASTFSTNPTEAFDLVFAAYNTGGISGVVKFAIILDYTLEIIDPLTSDPSFKKLISEGITPHQAGVIHENKFLEARDSYFLKKNQFTVKKKFDNEPNASFVRIYTPLGV